VFVITHNAPAEIPENGVYTFVTGGIEQALKEARSAAGDKNISVMGGAEIARQYIRAGLLDEISIHLVPVLFGSGKRLFENLGSDHIQLEAAPEMIATPSATHLRYSVNKQP
jgi:dihydrofolate reductase